MVFARLMFLLIGFALVLVTLRELFPGRTNPNSLFSEVFDILRVKDEIKAITGDPMKAFGRDVGQNTEGRRNHIDSRKYKADDGSNRTRIKFNIKGPKGYLYVWAEVKLIDTFIILNCKIINNFDDVSPFFFIRFQIRWIVLSLFI